MNIRTLLSTCAGLGALLLTAPCLAAAVLYGITGDGASTKETLYILDQTDASATEVILLGNGSPGGVNGGEAIAYNPVDQLLYRWSGFSSGRVLNTFDPTTQVISSVALSGDVTDEVTSAVYNPTTGDFLVADLATDLFSLSFTGVASNLCSACLPDKPRGLAFISDGGTHTLYSGSANDDKLWTMDPGTGAILSEKTITVSGLSSGVGISDVGLAVNPDSNELWGILRTTLFDTRLVTIDPDTGVATQIGILSDKFSSIAFVPTPVPLPPALLLLGSGLLGMAGLARRGSKTVTAATV